MHKNNNNNNRCMLSSTNSRSMPNTSKPMVPSKVPSLMEARQGHPQCPSTKGSPYSLITLHQVDSHFHHPNHHQLHTHSKLLCSRIHH